MVTPVVYATEWADESVGSESSVATEVVAEEADADDGSNDATDLVETSDPTDDVDLEESNDSEELSESVDTELEEDVDSPEWEETEVLEETDEVSTEELSEENNEEDLNLEESEDAVVSEEDNEEGTLVEENNEEEVVAEEDNSEASENVEEAEEVSEPAYGQVIYPHQEDQIWRAVTWGLIVVAADTLWAFPEGTEMVVTPIDEEEVLELVDEATAFKVTKARAVDITFYYEWEEIEPVQPISVTIRTQTMEAPQAVLHIDDDNNVEEIDSNINAKTVKFDAEGFSIYVIVEGKTHILTVNLYNWWEEPVTVYIESASELEWDDSMLYDPGVENLWKQVFRGWTTEENYTSETEWKTIAEVRNSLKSKFPLGDDETVNFYAMTFNLYKVTYLDEVWIVINTHDVLFRGEPQQLYEYTVEESYTPKGQYWNFVWWKIVGSGDTLYQLNDKIDIIGNITLRADVKDWHWLVFDENGKWATYNAPQFVEITETTKEPPLAMTRFGYTFGGWYEDKTCTEKENECTDADKFVFDRALEDNTTIYAKWIAKTNANYTVLIWKQKIDGEWYEFGESIALEWVVWQEISSISESGEGNDACALVNWIRKEYKWFHLDNYQEHVEIVPEDTAVVNVYYNRDEYTLSFQSPIYTKTNNNTEPQYGLYGGEYVEIYRNGWNWYRTRTRYYDMRGIERYEYSDRYNGDRYVISSWNTIKSITGLYEQDISDEFPIIWNNWVTYVGYVWEPQSSNEFTWGDVPTLDIMPSENTIFHAKKYGNGTNAHMYYYIETVDNSWEEVYNGKHFEEYQHVEISANGGINSTKTEDFYNMVGFNQYTSVPAYDSEGKVSLDESNNYTIKFYYTREKYKVHFEDGIYLNGDNSQNWLHQNLESNDRYYTYGENIEELEDFKLDNYQWYAFEWRYMDDACTQPYTFDTMPKNNITAYAKWRQIQYRVFLHPNVPADDTTLNWGSDSQAMNFRWNYWGKISVPMWWKRDDFEFVWWYLDPGLTKSFNADVFILNDSTVTEDYNKGTDFTDPMDKWWNGATRNSDVRDEDWNPRDRFWITKKLDLYAKWRSKLLWASWMNILYDANWWNNAPTDDWLYVDWAEVVAWAASTPADPNEQQFKYWEVQKWIEGNNYEPTGIKVYPGQTFNILKEYAEVVENEWSTEEEPSFTYTVKLVAVYGDIEEEQKTEIEYCPNYGDLPCTKESNITANTWHIIKDVVVLGDNANRVWYTFSWWNTQSEPNGESGWFNTWATVWVNNVGLPDVPNKLYAQWTVNKYKITFIDEDWSIIKVSVDDENDYREYDYGTVASEIIRPANPTKEWYKFKWRTPTIKDVTEDKTYTAQYFEDKNNNDIDDSTEDHFTVEFLPGDHGTLVWTTKYENILSGLTFEQAGITVPTINPSETYKVKSENGWWDNAVVTTVIANATYTAQYFEDKNNNDIDDSTEEVVLTFNAGKYGTINNEVTYTVPNLLPWYDKYPTSPIVTPNERYEFDKWSPLYTVWADILLDNPILSFAATYVCATGYHDKSLEDNTSVWETAGRYTTSAWELDSTALECESNTKTVTCRIWDDKIGTYAQVNVEITWSNNAWSEAELCALSCPSWYHLNGNKDACERNSWWGGGSWGGKTPDDCPNGDKSWDRYDWTCDAPGGGWGDDEEIELGWQVSDKCSVEGSNLSEEEIAAYLYACENDITTIRDINEARLGDYLNRAEMAKIISVFATKELWMKPNTSKDCSNFAASMEWWSQEMKDYMVMSCQLELMWIHTVNYEPIPDFMPAKRVSRAEFGTILSRVLWWDTYEGTNENYYFRHLDALKANGIITNIDPNITEYRAWVFLMIYRSVEKIKASIGDTSKSVEEEVNEELKEEWNEWTWTTIWMPNPASVYCEQQGWTVDLESSKCKLADGTEVDEWEYYRANNKEEESDTETTTD